MQAKSWSPWFHDRVDRARDNARRPSCGFIVTDDGDIPLNTPEGRAALKEHMKRA